MKKVIRKLETWVIKMPKTPKKELACLVKELDAPLRVAAAIQAMAINPCNRPLHENRPSHLAVLTTKYWGTGGVNLTVGFMEPTSAELRNKILSVANLWGNHCNVKFSWTQTDPQVRISRGSGGYWSYLGTDVLAIPKNQPTMNLEGFTLSTPDKEYLRVVVHEFGHCLSGETMIDCPRDLSKHPFGIPIKDLVGQQPWVYAWKDGSLVIKRASRVWLSKRSAKTIRVKLGTGQGGRRKRKFLPPLEIVGTPDHLVLLSDGMTWKKLGDLKRGDRLCSLYRNSNGERSTIRWTGHNNRVREHVFVCEQVYGDRPSKCDAHHINNNKLDQSPENLEWKDEFSHHSEHSKGRKLSEEHKKKLVETWTGRKHSEEAKKKMSESHKKLPPMTEETKAKLSAVSKGKSQSPELVAKRTEGIRRYYANGGKSGMFGKKASEETKRKRSVSMLATLAKKKGQQPNNHVVISIEEGPVQDVYDMTVPGADSFIANGVVVHNSLGFPHEHARKQLVDQLDREKTIQWGQQNLGWSRQMVIQQILTPLEESSIMGTPTADQDSIMCYMLPASITKTGQPIRGGGQLSPADKEFAAKVYPSVTQPPPPPPPPPPGVFLPPVLEARDKPGADGKTIAKYVLTTMPGGSV